MAFPPGPSKQAVADYLATATLSGGALTASAPMTLEQTWNNAGVTFTGLKVNVTNTASASGSLLADVQVGGSSRLQVRADGILRLGDGVLAISGTDAKLWRDGLFGWSDSTNPVSGGLDVILARDAANTLAQRNGTNAQVSRGYRTFTDASNYERWALQSGAGYFELASETAGTGTDNIDLRLTPAGTGIVSSAAAIKSTSATAGIGYAAGAGGAVTQITSRTTGVTLNNVTGAITLVSAAGSATPATFTVTNSAVAATDVIIVNQKSGTDLYETHVTAVAAGSFNISFWTTGGTTTEQPVFNFAVIKGVAA